MRLVPSFFAGATLLLLAACSEPPPEAVAAPELDPVPELSAVANGGAKDFVAHLEGREEVSPVETLARGQAKFVLGDDPVRHLDFKVIVANLVKVHQAHIHLGERGENGPVVAFLYGPATGMDVNGILAEGRLWDSDIIPRPEHSFNGTLEQLVERMRRGRAYVNAHTMEYPGGEIRGQIRPAGIH